jgi:hypothetical protein
MGLPNAQDNNPVQRDTVALATITTDTGYFKPGNKDFSRFLVPGMCLGATDEATEIAIRSISAQVAYGLKVATKQVDTLPSVVTQIARNCGARFSVANVTEGDLPDLFELALIAGNDSVAHAVVERLYALAQNAAEQAIVLRKAVEWYLDAKPARFATAEVVAARLDAMGPQQGGARLLAHGELLKFARASFDEPTMRKEAERIIRIGHEVPMRVIQYDCKSIVEAYMALGEIAQVESPDSIIAVVKRAKQDLDRFPPGQDNGFRAMNLNGVRNVLVPTNAEQFAEKPFPAIAATAWFPNPPTSWPPGNGKPSLIIYGDRLAGDCVRSDGSILTFVVDKDRINNWCGPLYAILPEWKKRYGDNLTITIVAETEGFAVRSTVLSPTEEADSIGWFFRHHLKLPVNVAVVTDSVWQVSETDGRQYHIDTTAFARFRRGSGHSPPTTLFYGAQGKLRFAGGFDASMLQPLIERTAGAEPSHVRSQKTP